MGIGSKLAAMAAYQMAPGMNPMGQPHPPGGPPYPPAPQHGQNYPPPPGQYPPPPAGQYPPPPGQHPPPQGLPYPAPPGSQQYPPPGGQPYQPPGGPPYPPPGSQPYPPPGNQPYPPPGNQPYPPPGNQPYPPPGNQPYPPPGSQQYPPPGSQPYPPQQPPPAGGPMGAGNSLKYRQQIQAKLTEVVNGRQLHAIYPPQRIDGLADHVSRTVDIEAVARQWRLPVEIALDLVSLALYDIVLYADDSYSMEGENWNSDLKTIVQRAAGVATLFDADGISVRFMNGKADRDNIRNEADVMALFRDAKPCGLTPIGTSLKAKVLSPFIEVLRTSGYDRSRLKPLMVVTITDGEPQGEPKDTLFNVISDTRNRLTSMGFTGNEVAFQFAQVGDDQKAIEFLDSLDNHPQIGRFVDATSNYEREAEQWQRRSGGASNMSPDLYLLKMLCGAIDNSWDSRDEAAPPGGYPPPHAGQPYPPQPGYPPQPYPGQSPAYPPQQPYPPPPQGYPYPPQPGYPPH